ncbi:MAG TPA: hypothetical protein PK961_01295 [bacterium]|nr:hypothetical protein [bacterium]
MKRTLLVLALLLIAATVAAQETNVKFTGYDIALIKLSQPYQTRTAAGEMVTYEQAYLVRVKGEFPLNGARLMELYIGEERIAEYGGYPGGLYFLLFTKDQLDKLAGRTIGYRLDHDGPIVRTAHVFTPALFKLDKPLSEKKALTRK